MNWGEVLRRSAVDDTTRAIVITTLAEANRRIKEAEPAPSSRMTFKGGKTRALGLIKKMADEVHLPWRAPR